MSSLESPFIKSTIKENNTIIIFGDSITAFGVIRGLRKIQNLKIYIVSNNNKGIAASSKYVKEVLRLNSNNPKYVETFIEWVKDRFTNKPLVLIAGDDQALIHLSKAYERLIDYVVLSFPRWEIVNKVINKETTYLIAEELDIPSIDTVRISNFEELTDYLKKTNINFPVFLKSSDSAFMVKNFSTKGEICFSVDQIVSAYNRYDGFNKSLLIQDFIPGDIDEIYAVLLVLNREGKVVKATANKKIRSGTMFGTTSLSSSIWNEELIRRSITLAESIGYCGPMGVQFKFDPRNNEYKFLEVNGRFSVSVSLSQKCDANLPLIVFNEFMTQNRLERFRLEKTYKENILLWYPLNDLRLITQKRFFKNPFAYFYSLIGRGYIVEPFSFVDPKPLIKMISQGTQNFFKRFKK
tara:strand:- start:740 stop:1966 length:1227 start_codon:yes stop_codon:yes gene_type:complete